MPKPDESLRAAFQNCIDRKCSADQLKSFLNRARTQWAGNEQMQSVIDELQNQI